MNKYDKVHQRKIAEIQRELVEIFKEFAEKVGGISGDIKNIDLDKPIDWRKYPLIKKRLDKVLEELGRILNIKTSSWVKDGWSLANEKNDALVKEVFGEALETLTKEQKARYYNNNDKALSAFLIRKEGGTSLSQRVWRITRDVQPLIESTIELGVKEGQSAAQIARNLKQYLVYPDKLFRRVRDKQGELHLSKNASMFHPGQGIYRSSYKNAYRLAATENNIAYRTADSLRYQQLDFVVGIRIQLSNNHTLNGKPFYDICDELAGDYPKWFKFVGWHPLCRCNVTSILKTMEETKRDLDGVDRGSVNEVKKLPKQFTDWVADNEERILLAEERGTLPYFLTQNRQSLKFLNRIKLPIAPISNNDILYLQKQGVDISKEARFQILSATPQGAQRIVSGLADIMANNVQKYSLLYEQRNGTISVLLNEIKLLKGKDEVLRIKKVNQLKSICASECQKDLESWGVVKGLRFVKLQKNMTLSNEATYKVNGKDIFVPKVQVDAVLFADKSGKKFAYPVGIKKDEVLFSASIASKICNNIPDFLCKQIEEIRFMNMRNPTDAYFEEYYKMPGFTAHATDGKKTTFWTKPQNGSNFHETICHESSHAFDRKHGLALKKEWVEAIAKDTNLAQRQNRTEYYPTSYSKVSVIEDFAESVTKYLKDTVKFKRDWPERARFIEWAKAKYPNG